MQLELVFADSEIARVEQTDGGISVRLSAAHVLRGQPGGKAEEGFSRAVRLFFRGARLDAPAADFCGRIAQGRVGDGMKWASALPLPGTLQQGPLQGELGLYNGAALAFTAAAVECGFEGEANWAESLFC